MNTDFTDTEKTPQRRGVRREYKKGLTTKDTKATKKGFGLEENPNYFCETFVSFVSFVVQ